MCFIYYYHIQIHSLSLNPYIIKQDLDPLLDYLHHK